MSDGWLFCDYSSHHYPSDGCDEDMFAHVEVQRTRPLCFSVFALHFCFSGFIIDSNLNMSVPERNQVAAKRAEEGAEDSGETPKKRKVMGFKTVGRL